MKKKIFRLSFLILIYIIIFNIKEDLTYNYTKEILLNNYIDNNIKLSNINGFLNIDKIGLKEVLYKIDSLENNLDNGLKIINKNNSIVILGHSGNSVKALFNNLIKLEKKDIIKLDYNNILSKYIVIDITTKEKKDKLVLDSDLILVTCLNNPSNKQLVIKCQIVDKISKK